MPQNIERIRAASLEYAQRPLAEGQKIKFGDVQVDVTPPRSRGRKLERNFQDGTLTKRQMRKIMPPLAKMVAERLALMNIKLTVKSPILLAKRISELSGGSNNMPKRRRAVEILKQFLDGKITITNAPPSGSPKKDKIDTKPKPAREGFYWSDAWRQLRYRRLVESGGRCQACGRTAKDGVIIHVDHIKPRSKYPELELAYDNTQVLCDDCNIGKLHIYETDWRPSAINA